LQNLDSVVLIGAGNLATNLGKALCQASVRILQVWSRTEASARMLAKELGCPHTTDAGRIERGAGLYIISVRDDAVIELTPRLSLENALVVHTSGSLPMEVLKNVSLNYGVFYPLQTFSRQRTTPFAGIPLCIEANNPLNLALLEGLARKLSNQVFEIDTRQRLILHLAAVFACNFPNFLYVTASDILAPHGLSFDLLKPLIRETTAKVQEASPSEVQTGPAIREDMEIIEKHLRLLEGNADYERIYRLLSENIIKYKKYHAQL
jgi:predicted short-subunit dehydrogenase-like oxidoreductase (DUF2520 family)